MSEPRLFWLERDVDTSGVSGTGRVADGVLWADGTVSLRWRGATPSSAHFDNLSAIEGVHGHGGSTRVVWADDQPAPAPARPRRPSAVPDDHPLDGLGDLALALGGAPDSWTGDALLLIARSDAPHRRELSTGIAWLVTAYLLWQSFTTTAGETESPRAGRFLATLDAFPGELV
ncbi:hypothetical protein MXD61_06910 [Frankia sp. AgPm24]|uniref:hypothetical protein n=1 Tax=Frankia sp. AgPm24 TaxID=631128 RepID=UPI00200E7185|nr:hypothetical protein [Frankia sp. AgPm24]MCK9921621.1 hypothetical protein [Frankia sp. AgPm24]